MEVSHTAARTFIQSDHFYVQPPWFRRCLAKHARQERALKIQLKRQMAGSNFHNKHACLAILKKKIAKHSRIRRKLIMLDRRLQQGRGHQTPSIYQAMQLVTHAICVPGSELASSKAAALLAVDQMREPNVALPMHLPPTEQPPTAAFQNQADPKGKRPIVCNPTCMPSSPATGSQLAHVGGSNNFAPVGCTIPSSFGPPTYTCKHCYAILWYEERIKRNKRTSTPQFTFCCMEGRVKLPLLKDPPTLLKHLLDPESGAKNNEFRQNIRAYNSMFAFASLGVQVDKLINKSKGPYVFRAGGQVYHNTSSLLPPTGKRPQFAQLYIYDTDHEISNRMNTMINPEPGPTLDQSIVQNLTLMLDEHNNLVKSYRKARDMFKAQPETTFHLRMPERRSTDGREHNIPSVSEVAGLIVGDLSQDNFERDIIVRHRTGGVTHITELHPCYMSMVYPLIHPHGEDGYRLGIPLADKGSETFKRQQLSMCQYYCFRFQQRLGEGRTLLQAGRLLQQYIVDAYMAVEQERFRWIQLHQKELRTELYSGLMDAMNRGDSDCSAIGKSIILPSSHTGGPRYRAQNYQDAMAICRWVGYPDLFITFTCNPKWPEINGMLNIIGQKDDPNRVDIVCRVFEIKLQQLMHYIKKDQPFGRVMACLYTIEFQKRGLPHAHILLFLHPTMKNPSPDYIDTIISAEIPDINLDRDGYNAVKKSMLHGPCGQANIDSPCMLRGKCAKHFPKKFSDHTIMGEDGFPIYRRRNTGIHVEKKNTLLDNRYVVPYNRNLVVKFDAHINVELCNNARSIKYLFKYINKGPDRATAIVENTAERDEIKAYLDCRYISATEACWRIFQFNINYRYPSVERLPFHLPGEHTVVFEENKCVENVLNVPGIGRTKFTEWLETNKLHEDARDLTYSEFPQQWVWNAKDKIWTRRKKGVTVGRIYFAKNAYDAIVRFVQHDEGKLFFISGHGGTWKTFLWNTVISRFRSESLIVLPVATTAIAALLMANGRTAHSRFRIPLDLTAESSCEIKHGTQLAKLLQNTSLIIWDEAPMAHKHAFEALDKSLRDILSTRYEDSRKKPFGGITMVCGGDFRQILPVIPKGTRADIVQASLNSSYLWPYFETHELKQNMRLYKEGLEREEAERIAAFDEWLLQIGDGSLYEDVEQETIRLPPDLCRPPNTEPMADIVDAIYPTILQDYMDPAYLKERAILTPKNETVHELNAYLMNIIPGEGRTYLSSDSICKASVKTDEDDILYPSEFLNSLKFNGIPNHDIRLKEGLPIMLLRNLNQSEGLCNGTRLIVTRLGKWSIRADIISGTNAGQNVTIPRIIMAPNESKWPFKLNRRQLPVAPCFAMTINKSQGQTLKHVGLFLPDQAFTHGQVYVALSRVSEREGLVVLNADHNMKDQTLIKNIVYREVFNNIHGITQEEGMI